MMLAFGPHTSSPLVLLCAVSCTRQTTMRRQRPTAASDPDYLIRSLPCATRLNRSGTLAVLLTAALLVVSPNAASSAETHARRGQGQGVGLAAFTAPLSSPAVWASLRRENEHLRRVGGSTGHGRAGFGAHRHFATTSTRGPLAGLQQDDSSSSTSRQKQGVARLLQVRPRHCSGGGRRVSSPSALFHAARAVGVGVNSTAGAEVAGEVPVATTRTKTKTKTKTEQTVRPSKGKKESTSVEGKEATVIITEAGGRPHTKASRAKISAANKGKKPWNVGVGHSEETRRKIAEGARNAARKRRQKTAESLGMTLEEYDEMKKRKPVGKKDPGVTEETRKKISARLKAKWQDPSYRERRKQCMPNRKGVPHTEETKARISAAVKNKWNDPVYREKITNMERSEETRAKIGRVIREQWANPVTREERMKNMAPRTEEHNKKIAASVRSKWLDPEYKKRTSEAMRKAAYDRIIANGGVPKPRRVRRPRVPRVPGEPGSRASRMEGVGISREAQRNLNRWAKQRKDAEVRLMRQAKKEERAREAAMKLAIKEAKAEAERIAKEEEAALTEGLDDLEKVLMRSTIRAKKQERLEKVAKAAAKAKAAEAAKAEPAQPEPVQPEQPVEAVPDGFEMVEINGRMVLRMK